MPKKLLLCLLVMACVILPSFVCAKQSNSVIDANNRLAFDLYRQYKTQESNMFLSPYSIISALGMVYEGARGNTLKQMSAVLHLPEDPGLIRSSFLDMHNRINKHDSSFELSSANALWAQKGYPLLDGYLGIVREYYGGRLENVDFTGDPSGSCSLINAWVGEKTNNKIREIISPDAVDSSLRLVLTNAIYFKGKWLNRFDKNDTDKEDFKSGSGRKVKVDMMRLVGGKLKFGYAEKDGLQVLELPYEGGRLSMLIFLPKEGGMASLEDSLDQAQLAELKGLLHDEEVNVFIPRFKFTANYSMSPALEKLGMPDAFSPGDADFSGMTGGKDLFISQVLHKAFVEVNEEGTEAAAATAVSMSLTAVFGEGPKVFYADHPFIFLIQEKDAGNILFLGKVNDPAE